MSDIQQKEKLKCSFCDKSQDDVSMLIAGKNNVFVCSECVAICNEIILERIKMQAYVRPLRTSS